MDVDYSRVIHEREEMSEDQVQAVGWLLDNPFSMLLADVGMGKAIMSLTTLVRLQERGEPVAPTLIIAPIRVVMQTWPTEIAEWRHTAHLTYTILRIPEEDPRVREYGQMAYLESRRAGMSQSGATRRRSRIETIYRERLRREATEQQTDIHLIDIGSVTWLVNHFARHRRWPYRRIIFDESSKLGERSNEVVKALEEVRPLLSRFHQLTATPASQTYMKFFSMVKLLDRGQRLSKFITHFRDRYFIHDPYKRTYALKPGADRQIEQQIADISYVMRKVRSEDEKPLIVRRPVILPPNVLAAYQAFERSSVLDLPDGDVIEAINAANLSNKLLQAAGGAVYDDERQVRWLHDEKIEELRQLHEELDGEPLMVAYWYKPSLARLRKAFPKAVVMDKEGKCVDAWNRGEIDMLLIHPQSAGHGLNMQHGGHHLACFDIFWALELFIQIIGRLDRRGQKWRVIVHMLIAQQTHDEAVAENLSRLESAQNAMYERLQALRRRFRN